MTTTKEFDTWLSSYGPQNAGELLDLQKVVGGAFLAGCYSGAPSKNRMGWHIKRDALDALNLSDKNARAGFKKLLWHYRTGERAWHQHPKRTLEERKAK